MANDLPFQCCVCKAVCWSLDAAGNRSEWVPCSRSIVASHGICPDCLPRELAKARRAIQDRSNVTLAP